MVVRYLFYAKEYIDIECPPCSCCWASLASLFFSNNNGILPPCLLMLQQQCTTFNPPGQSKRVFAMAIICEKMRKQGIERKKSRKKGQLLAGYLAMHIGHFDLSSCVYIITLFIHLGRERDVCACSIPLGCLLLLLLLLWFITQTGRVGQEDYNVSTSWRFLLAPGMPDPAWWYRPPTKTILLYYERRPKE